MPTRQQLHHLVDQLPDTEIPTVHRLLLLFGADPVLYSLLTAPLDDEPETEDERRAVKEAREAAARGEGITTEELSRKLGL